MNIRAIFFLHKFANKLFSLHPKVVKVENDNLLTFSNKVDEHISSFVRLRDSGNHELAKNSLNAMSDILYSNYQRSQFELAIIYYVNKNYDESLKRIERVDSNLYQASCWALQASIYYFQGNIDKSKSYLIKAVDSFRDFRSRFFIDILGVCILGVLNQNEIESKICNENEADCLIQSLLYWWKIPNIWHLTSSFNLSIILDVEKFSQLLNETQVYANFLLGLCVARCSRDNNMRLQYRSSLVAILKNFENFISIYPHPLKACAKVFPEIDEYLRLMDESEFNLYFAKYKEFEVVEELMSRYRFAHTIYNSLFTKFADDVHHRICDVEVDVVFFGQLRSSNNKIQELVDAINGMGFKKSYINFTTWEKRGSHVPTTVNYFNQYCSDDLKKYIYDKLVSKNADIIAQYTIGEFFNTNIPAESIFNHIPELRQLFTVGTYVSDSPPVHFAEYHYWSQEFFESLYENFLNRQTSTDRSTFLHNPNIVNQFRMWYCIGAYLEARSSQRSSRPNYLFFVRPDLCALDVWQLDFLKSNTFLCDIEPNCLMTGSGGLGDRYMIIHEKYSDLLKLPYDLLMGKIGPDLFNDKFRFAAHQLLELIVFSSGIRIDFTSTHLPFQIDRGFLKLTDMKL